MYKWIYNAVTVDILFREFIKRNRVSGRELKKIKFNLFLLKFVGCLNFAYSFIKTKEKDDDNYFYCEFRKFIADGSFEL